MTPEKTLQARLARTWGAFFRRYANFTPTQKEAIPLVLDGKNLVISAPTASGKTEAALAPLIENYLYPLRTQQLYILYILPTRALIHDLQQRLLPILDNLQVSLAVKTHDLNTFSPQHPTDLLLTTPESFDSLLTNHPKTLIGIQAVVLDELHYLDGTVRGDQLRILLKRLRQIKEYAYSIGDASRIDIQYVALSATLAQPEKTADRYFPNASVLTLVEQRLLQFESIPLGGEHPSALVDYLKTFYQRGWRKALVFCNTRAEVETYATFIRQAKTGFATEVFTHYSNLTAERRHAIERQFGESNVAICFATSTLELGIDVGSIDVVLLIGPPHDSASFFQRVGRANRRQKTIQVVCFYRTVLESLIFERLPSLPPSAERSPFRTSVAVQQVFSLLKQSRNNAIRLLPLARLWEGILTKDDLERILGRLQDLSYLKPARMGEWRAGDRLNTLMDQQGYLDTPLSIYSNMESLGQQAVDIRDKYTQNTIARVDRQWLLRDNFTLEGQSLDVMWQDKKTLWVSASPNVESSERPFYLSTRQPLSFEITQHLAHALGWTVGEVPFVSDGQGGGFLFHWLGDIYGRILCEMWRPYQPVYDTTQYGLCLYIADSSPQIPFWREDDIRTYIQRHSFSFEKTLQLGAYQHFLPKDLRQKVVIEHLNIPRLMQYLQNLRLISTTVDQATLLMALIND